MATYIRSVDGRVQVEIEPEQPATLLPNISDQGLQVQIDALRTEIRTYRGQPVVVTDSADMDNELTIYLYMGSEEGFNADHWYYYDGTEWVDGGEYVANPVIIDDTLTQSGEAADAKVTGDEISAIKADLTQITVKSKNLFPIETLNTEAFGMSVEYKDGVITFNGTREAVTPDYNYSACTPITLPAGTYSFSRSSSEGQTILRKVAGTSTTNVAVLQGTTNSAHFTLSETTTLYLYLGITATTYDNKKLYIQLETGSTANAWEAPFFEVKDMPEIKADITEIKADIEEIGLPYDSAVLSWTSGKAFVYNAGWTNNSGWSYADVELMQGQSLDITLYCNTSVYPLSVWSDDGTSILKACFPVSSEAGEKHFIYACSAQHEKVRINVQTSYKSTVVARIYKPDNQVNVSNIATINHGDECFDVLHASVIAIGDSLTQGSYTGNDLHTDQSYPAFMAKKMGNTVVNAGRAGWNTKEWWDGDSTSQKGFPYYTYTDYDTAVICLGTNGGLTDTLDTDVEPYDSYTEYANTNTGSYCKIIEGIKAQNAAINILLCNIWAGGGTGGIDVTNTVINKIATKYGLHVIDLLTEFRTAYSIYHAVSGNIHLGRIGYARMADIIRQAINNNVLERPTNYNYIPS